MSPFEYIGHQLKSKREELNMGQGTVANRARITQSYLSKIENGTDAYNLSVLIRLCKVLGLPELKILPNERE